MQPAPLWNRSVIILVAVISLAFIAALACSSCHAADRPDPFVRMESPSGCSGGVIHASRQYGIWIASCKHCVARRGQAVTFRFFWRGRIGPQAQGRCYGSHPLYDASISVVAADALPVLPAVTPLSRTPARVGDVVISVGSFAGQSRTPALQRVTVTDVDRDGYGLRLNDHVWGGHSGGPVLDQRHELVGVVWGHQRSRRRSLVTSAKALWDIVLDPSHRQRTRDDGQAFFSVVPETAAARKTIRVYGHPSREALESIQAHPLLSRAVRIERRRGTRYATQWVWRDCTGRVHRLWGDPTPEELLAELAQCPHGDCGPWPNGQAPEVPGNPWLGGVEPDEGTDDIAQEYEQRIAELEAQLDEQAEAHAEQLEQIEQEQQRSALEEQFERAKEQLAAQLDALQEEKERLESRLEKEIHDVPEAVLGPSQSEPPQSPPAAPSEPDEAKEKSFIEDNWLWIAIAAAVGFFLYQQQQGGAGSAGLPPKSDA